MSDYRRYQQACKILSEEALYTGPLVASSENWEVNRKTIESTIRILVQS